MFGFLKSLKTPAKPDCPMVEPPAAPITSHAIGVDRVQHLQPGDAKGKVRGKHYTEWVEAIKDLKRSGSLAEAETLLLECISAAEGEALAEHLKPAPWYYDELGIVYRKLNDKAASDAVAKRKKRCC